MGKPVPLQRTNNRLPNDGKPTEWMFEVYHRHVCRAETMKSIAMDVGMSPQRIGQVVADVDDYLSNEQWHVSRIKVEKGRQLARLEHVYKEAWDAFVRSITTSTRKVVLGKDRGGESDYSEEVTQRLAGDPRFLREMREAMADRRKILGLDAPRKSSITNAAGDGPAEIKVMIENMSDEELEKLAEYHEFLERVQLAHAN